MGAILKLWEVDAGVVIATGEVDSGVFQIGPAGNDQNRVGEFAETAVIGLASDAAGTFTIWQAQRSGDLPIPGGAAVPARLVENITVYAPAASITPITVNLALPFIRARFVVGGAPTTFLQIYVGVRFR